jgi:hypothetical protein
VVFAVAIGFVAVDEVRLDGNDSGDLTPPVRAFLNSEAGFIAVVLPGIIGMNHFISKT